MNHYAIIFAWNLENSLLHFLSKYLSRAYQNEILYHGQIIGVIAASSYQAGSHQLSRIIITNIGILLIHSSPKLMF